METIGLIGIGVMGRTVAVKVIEGGYPVLAYDVSPACIEKAAALGVSIAPTLSDVTRQARIILMLLPGPADVKACVAGPDGLLAAAVPGTVIVDMATSDPATTVEMADLARARACRIRGRPRSGPARDGRQMGAARGRQAGGHRSLSAGPEAFCGPRAARRAFRGRAQDQALEPDDVRRYQRHDGRDDGGRRAYRDRAEAPLRHDHPEPGRHGQQPFQGTWRPGGGGRLRRPDVHGRSPHQRRRAGGEDGQRRRRSADSGPFGGADQRDRAGPGTRVAATPRPCGRAICRLWGQDGRR